MTPLFIGGTGMQEVLLLALVVLLLFGRAYKATANEDDSSYSSYLKTTSSK